MHSLNRTSETGSMNHGHAYGAMNSQVMASERVI